jgi:MFS family permease
VSSPSAKPERPYRVLQHRDFRLLWGSQLVSLTGTQMQVVALNWHVYLLTHSPLALGMVGLSRVLPIILFSLWGGIVADRFDRRRVMFAAQSCMAAFSAALAILTLQGRTSLGVLYGLNALGAAASSFDNPARQALVPRLVPPAALSSALSLNLAMFHMAMIGGPGIAGLVLAAGSRGLGSVAAIYAFNGFSFAVVLVALALMKTSGRPAASDAPPEHPWEALKAGLRFVFTTPLMVWTTGLDFVATFFAGALSMLPIFADQILHVGAAGYGWLVAAPALGALAGSLYAALVPLPRRQGRLFLCAVIAYGLFTMVWGLSTRYMLVFLFLAASGLADLVSTVIRQTLRQVITPDALRGRMTSVNMIFFMGGPQLGELEAGLVASLLPSAALGARVAVVTGGLATMLAGALVLARSRLVRDYQPPAGDTPSG